MPKSVKGVMEEFKAGKLHSGSKTGPIVTNRKQAIAEALSEQRQMKREGNPKAMYNGGMTSTSSPPGRAGNAASRLVGERKPSKALTARPTSRYGKGPKIVNGSYRTGNAY